MSLFGWVLSICIPTMAVCGFASSILTLLMVEKLNEGLPTDRQFDAIGWNPRTRVEFDREYRRVFGKDRLWRRRRLVAVVGFAAVLSPAAVLMIRC
jgi:hypothetical protein